MLAEAETATDVGAGAAGRVREGARGAVSAKLAIVCFCTGLVAATLAPVTQNWARDARDGFPFSYYPMFSRRLGETYRVTHVVGVDRDGREHVVPYRYLGLGGLNQVRVTVQRAARREPRRFCEQVAANLRAQPTDELRGVREIVLRTAAYVMSSFYAGRIEARSTREHARCRVAR